MDFLVRHAAVQYIPSLSIWEMAKQGGKANSQGKVLAFAPSYDSSYINPTRSAKIRNMRKGLSPLAGATKEVEQLKEHYSGDYFLGLEATEAGLKKQLQSGKYAVMHLAMHGLLDEKNTENSALALSETPQDSTEDNFLYGAEIALLNAKAQLVVLSACETGTGKIVGGEGQLSLARYFLRAGVPSLIATRWQINDQATAMLIQNFYKELDKDQNIAQSLRQAQLSYLNDVEDLAAHPHFWAAFFNTGYTDQVISLRDKNALNPNWLYALGLGLLGLLGMGWWWFRKKQG
jgi:CHAT domain-containing protein